MQNNSALRKYHQAAFVYIANAGLYFYIATFRMPPHSFGRYVDPVFYVAGGLMAILFPYFIYKGYRRFTMVLAGIYLIRTIASLMALPFYTNTLTIISLTHVLTFYMLIRAVWNLRP